MTTVGGGQRGPMPGDPSPWFTGAVLKNNEEFAFDRMAGRHVLLLFIDGMSGEAAAAALAMVKAQRDLLDDRRAMFFGVTRDRADVAERRIEPMLPGIRWFLDYDSAIARRFGAVVEGQPDSHFWLLLDPMLRVVARAGIDQGAAILGMLRGLVSAPQPEGSAPVLIVPNVFEPGLCRHLIGLYEAQGGQTSGFMRDVGGKTVGLVDKRIKLRSDYAISHEDAELRNQIQLRLGRRLVPLMARFLAFQATRMERYIVACYDADGEGGAGFFSAHRDNTTAGTAHRRFACTINLNADDYEGGDLVFPEFGTRRYRAPTGGAVVFACGMLHEALPVTRGKRYAYLPFFYDEAAARQREEIAKTGKVDGQLASYRA